MHALLLAGTEVQNGKLEDVKSLKAYVWNCHVVPSTHLPLVKAKDQWPSHRNRVKKYTLRIVTVEVKVGEKGENWHCYRFQQSVFQGSSFRIRGFIFLSS